MTDFLKTNVDFRKNFIRGAARLIITDMSVGFMTKLSDQIVMTTVGNVSEVQTITITGTPTAGTFTLSYKGYTTSAIPFNATAAVVDAALEQLGSIGGGNVTTAGGPGPATAWTVTFAGSLANQAVPLITPDSTLLTGGTTPLVTVTRTTPGVGLYDAKAGCTDLGATKGGITVARNNSEETFSVDQINSDILSLPTAWEMSVSSSVAQNDIDMLQYLWEGGAITFDSATGERTLPLGAPTSYRQKRLTVFFQRPSLDGGVTVGLIRAYAFRITQRSATESSIVHNREGDQATIPFTWKCLADSTVGDQNARFGSIIDQA